MKALFNLISALLGLDGLLHLMKVFANSIDPSAMAAVVLTAGFGVAYLVIGYFLWRRADWAVRAGFIVPLVGLLLTLVGMKPNPDFYVIAFIILDVLIVAGCAYLMTQGRGLLRRR